MFKKLALAIAGIALMTTTATVARAESALDFALVNKTGYPIQSVFIAPSSSTEWGEDVMGEDILPDGGTVNISFHPKDAKIKKWDLLVKWEDESDPDVSWTGFTLSEINKITIKYDRKTDKTSATIE